MLVEVLTLAECPRWSWTNDITIIVHYHVILPTAFSASSLRTACLAALTSNVAAASRSNANVFVRPFNSSSTSALSGGSIFKSMLVIIVFVRFAKSKASLCKTRQSRGKTFRTYRGTIVRESVSMAHFASVGITYFSSYFRTVRRHQAYLLSIVSSLSSPPFSRKITS